MTHYFFRGPIADRAVSYNRDFDYYEVAKFDPDASGPATEIYRIYLGTESCNCQSPYKPCKHTQWLKYWLDLPHPLDYYLDDQTNQFRRHPFTARGGLDQWLP